MDVWQVVAYAGAGVYDVQVVAPAVIGRYQLTLALGDEPIAGNISVQVGSVLRRPAPVLPVHFVRYTLQ